MGGVGTGVWTGIPVDFHLSLPVPLVDVLYQTLPLVKRGWFFCKYKCVLDAIGERLLQPMAECTISPVDLARKHIEINKEISELLVSPHAERIEFGLRGGFRIRVSKHFTELFDEAWPII